MDVNLLLKQISSGNPKASACASADLASLIWSGKIDEEVVEAWLVNGEESVRGAVSWAVWDAGRPWRALLKLMEFGANDENDSVRLYSLRSVIQYMPVGDHRTQRLSEFISDECESIRARAKMELASG